MKTRFLFRQLRVTCEVVSVADACLGGFGLEHGGMGREGNRTFRFSGGIGLLFDAFRDVCAGFDEVFEGSERPQGE